MSPILKTQLRLIGTDQVHDLVIDIAPTSVRRQGRKLLKREDNSSGLRNNLQSDLLAPDNSPGLLTVVETDVTIEIDPGRLDQDLLQDQGANLLMRGVEVKTPPGLVESQTGTLTDQTGLNLDLGQIRQTEDHTVRLPPLLPLTTNSIDSLLDPQEGIVVTKIDLTKDSLDMIEAGVDLLMLQLFNLKLKDYSPNYRNTPFQHVPSVADQDISIVIVE